MTTTPRIILEWRHKKWYRWTLAPGVRTFEVLDPQPPPPVL